MNPLTALCNAFLLATGEDQTAAGMMFKRCVEIVPMKTKYDFVLDFTASLIAEDSPAAMEKACKDLDTMFSFKRGNSLAEKYEIAVAMLGAAVAKAGVDNPMTQIIDFLASPPANAPPYN